MEKERKILIVDDDTDFMEISKLSLEGEGFRIISAYNAQEGWKLVEEEKPDLVIMDLMMERLDAGMVLSQQIKKDPRFASVPILMLTSISRETGMDFAPRTAEDLRQLHVDDFGSKPIKKKTLLEKVEKLLGLKDQPAGKKG
jgi:CheY-like chemotaxis protein